MRLLHILFYLLFILSVNAMAHTLGVDKANLTEIKPGSYQLVTQTPAPYQTLIKTPMLPDKCVLDGNPHGIRSTSEVRFDFTCTPSLSTEDEIILPWQREGILMTVSWFNEEPVTLFSGRNGPFISLHMSEFLAGSGSVLAAAKRYTLLGIEHILAGIDHLLFVLALLLIVRGGWPLVKTISAFTIAHSITLGLATLGFLNISSAPVEATIALSIVFLCVEIIHAQQDRRPGIAYTRPWLVAFLFGLLHGLGFAGALSEIGLPPSEIPIALLFFNVGVEMGQLIFVFTVLAVLLLLKKTVKAVNNASFALQFERFTVYAIGTIASYWLIERGLAIV